MIKWFKRKKKDRGEQAKGISELETLEDELEEVEDASAEPEQADEFEARTEMFAPEAAEEETWEEEEAEAAPGEGVPKEKVSSNASGKSSKIEEKKAGISGNSSLKKSWKKRKTPLPGRNRRTSSKPEPECLPLKPSKRRPGRKRKPKRSPVRTFPKERVFSNAFENGSKARVRNSSTG